MLIIFFLIKRMTHSILNSDKKKFFEIDDPLSIG